MKLADVEFLAQSPACILTQFFKLELANFISERLAGPDDVTIHFDRDVVLRLACSW